MKKNNSKKKTANRSLKEKRKKKEEDSLKEIRVRVVGLGGGGGSIISGISSDLKKVFFAAVNTDVHALEEVTKKKKIKSVSFGKKITGGLGTGMDWKMGKKAAEEDIEEIKPLFKDYDIVIFVASLGGGTGSGALPVFASAAREMGSLVYGVVTLPFSFEGEKKMRIAKEAIKEAGPHLHAITVLPNERIFETVDKNTALKEALRVVNENLAKSLEGLMETIYETGLINIDFADVKTVLENRKGNRKLTYLSTAEGKIEEGVQSVVKRAVSSPLYPYSISNARGILFNVTGGKDIGLTDVSSVSRAIAGHIEDEAKIIIGIMQKNKYRGKIKISLLATGCGTDFFKKELGEDEKTVTVKKEPPLADSGKKAKSKKEPKKKKAEKKKRKTKNKKEEKEKITVVSINKKRASSPEEKPKEPQNEEEKRILKEEKRWERPSFLRKLQ